MGTKSIESFKAKHFSPIKKELTVKKIETRTVAKVAKGNNQDKAGLEIKVRKHILKVGYEILNKKYGFDLCAKKSAFFDSDKYLAIDFNQNNNVTASDVNSFLKKLNRFVKTVGEGSHISPEVSWTNCLHRGITKRCF